MTSTTINCPACQHQYQRTYPNPHICPACGKLLEGCYNRPDVSREAKLWVQDGYVVHGEMLDKYHLMLRDITIPNAFRTQVCEIGKNPLPSCGDCKWRQDK